MQITSLLSVTHQRDSITSNIMAVAIEYQWHWYGNDYGNVIDNGYRNDNGNAKVQAMTMEMALTLATSNRMAMAITMTMAMFFIGIVIAITFVF